MWKTTLFSICSLLIALAVIGWILGVIPSNPTLRRPSPPAQAARPTAGPTPPAAAEDNLSVYFSPNGGCTEALLREINNASQSVYVQAAQFTSAPIAKALVAARQRGLDVRVVIDGRKDDDEKSEADRLLDGGVPTFTDERHHTAHNKVMLVDHRILFTGSFNFTRTSETDNAENLLRIEGRPKLLAAYETNFKEHLAHSTPYRK